MIFVIAVLGLIVLDNILAERASNLLLEWHEVDVLFGDGWSVKGEDRGGGGSCNQK